MYNRFSFNPRRDNRDILSELIGPSPVDRQRPLVPVDMPMEPENKPLSFLDQFNQIANKRPMREQLLQMIANAPKREDYQPKWYDRVGAGLAGVSEGWQRGAGAGIATARNVLDAPYNEAEQTYEDKLKRTGLMSQLEDQDIQTAIEGLKTQHSEDINVRDFKERQLESRVRSSEAADELKQRGDISAEDRKARIQSNTDDNTGAMARERAGNASNERIANANIQGRADVANIKAQAMADKLKQAAASMKPEDVNKKVYNDLAAFATKYPDIDIRKYISVDDATKRVSIKPDDSGLWGIIPGDDTRDKEIKDAVRAIVESGYSGKISTPSSNSKLPPGWSK